MHEFRIGDIIVGVKPNHYGITDSSVFCIVCTYKDMETDATYFSTDGDTEPTQNMGVKVIGNIDGTDNCWNNHTFWVDPKYFILAPTFNIKTLQHRLMREFNYEQV